MIRIARSLPMMVLTILASSSAPAGPPAAASAPQAKPWPVAKSAAAYTPQFSIAKTEFEHYWISDHGQRIALFGGNQHGTAGYQIGLFRPFPGQEVDESRIKDWDVLDFVSLPGLRLDTNWIGAPGDVGVPGEMKLDVSDPRQVTIRLSWKKSAQRVRHPGHSPGLRSGDGTVCRPRGGRPELSHPGGGEYCNFYANGLGDFRPGVSRYDRLLFQDASDGGKLKAHYVSCLVNKPVHDHILLSSNSLIGYADEKDGNPVVIVEESTPRAMLGICPCWFDAHLIWDEPREVDRADRSKATFAAAVSGPPYRYHAKLKAYWNSPGRDQSACWPRPRRYPWRRLPTASRRPSHRHERGQRLRAHRRFPAGKVEHIYFRRSP